MVVDGDVQEPDADALDAIPAVAGNTVGWSLEAHQALDIQVQQIARLNFNRRSTRLTVAGLTPSCNAIRMPVHRSCLSRSISILRSSDILRGDRRGRELRSLRLAAPCSLYRRTHFAAPWAAELELGLVRLQTRPP